MLVATVFDEFSDMFSYCAGGITCQLEPIDFAVAVAEIVVVFWCPSLDKITVACCI